MIYYNYINEGSEGQLGLGSDTSLSCEDDKKELKRFGIVKGLLENEIVVSVAAGDLTSYAITASGKVYHW